LGEGTLAAYVLFFALAATAVGTSVAMMFSRNLVHSTVYLAGALLAFAGLYASLDASLIALIQVFVYAGAVTVFILFVVMMTRERVDTYSELLQRQTWLAILVAIALSVPLVQASLPLTSDLPTPVAVPAGTSAIAEALLTTQAAPFEVASLVLLAALVGAIYLAREAD
jgi:NADH-quinone oxidoreductase subunit J